MTRNRSLFGLGSPAAGAIVALVLPCAMQALPNPISSCQTITTDSSLSADIGAGTGACIIIGANNISVFLNGHTIDVRAGGISRTGILVVGKTNILIKGPGKVLTAYEYDITGEPIPTAIKVIESTEVEIHGVTVQNQEVLVTPVADGTTCPESPFGIGIEMIASGGNIHSNTVSCFQAGIDVLQSNPVTAGNIGFNTVTDNRIGLTIGVTITNFGSFGIGLRGSSNWTVNHNTVNSNGGGGTALGVNLPLPLSGGIILEGPTGGVAIPALGSSNNTVVGNAVMNNSRVGIGIAFGSTGNVVVNNTSKQNIPTDMSDQNTPNTNTWVNDRCVTEVGGVPVGLCHP